MTKKIVSLISIIPLVASCSLTNRTKICGDVDAFFGIKENTFQEANSVEIYTNLALNRSFCLYLTNQGCSSCEEFSPIANKFVKESGFLTYKYDVNEDREQLRMLQNEDGKLVFNGLDDYSVSTPSFILVDSQANGYNINYTSYMKTEKAFFNHIKSKFELSNIYFTKGDVLEKDFVDQEFVYIHFDFGDLGLMNIYKNLIFAKANASSKTVIVSNKLEDGLRMDIVGKNKNKEVYYKLSNKFDSFHPIYEEEIEKFFK